MKRPMLYILLFIAIGIIAGQYADSFLHIALFMVCVTVFSCVLVRLFDIKWLLVLPCVAFTACAVCCNASADSSELDFMAAKRIRTSGVVHSVLYTSDNKNCFTVDVVAFDIDGKSDIIDKNVRLRVYASQKLRVGDMVVLKGNLVPVGVKTNPSDFDRRAYMLARKQIYSFYAQDVYVSERKLGLNTFLQDIKQKVCDTYYKIMPPKEAGVMCGMMLGETENIDDSTVDLYKKTGIYHVIAISGLHITLLGGVLLKMFSRFGRGKGRAVVAILLGCYCLMTGCSPSAVRAVIMFYIMLVGGYLFYDYDLISSAALSACVLLLYSPYYLFDAGFQLSFCAVFAIGAVMDFADTYKKYAKAINAVGINIAVDIVTKPVSMFHFYYIAPFSIVANFMLVPLMTLAVGFGFIIALTGFVNVTAARIIAIPVVIILKVVEIWCGMFTALPFSTVVTGRPPLLLLALYAFVLIIAYNCIIKGCFKYILTLMTAVGCALPVMYTAECFKNPTITFLNVGQGDCAVGIGRNYCFVIDGGAGAPLGGYGNGKKVLLPYLMYSGIDRIDAVFISHTDSDHIGGILEIMGSVDIDSIYLPEIYDNNDNYKQLTMLAKCYGVDLVYMKEGTSLVLNETDKIECLYPSSDNPYFENNCSMVNKFVCEKGSVLFTGDIESDAEKLMCKTNVNVRADVLKLAHHGSEDSNTSEFIETVKPSLAVASAKKSVYGHPGKEVISRLNDMQVPYYITESDGAISIEFADEGIYVKPYLED